MLWLTLLTIIVFAIPFYQVFSTVDFSQSLSVQHPIVKLGITIILVGFAALLMNNICNRKNFLYEKSNLPAAITIILGSHFYYFSYTELVSVLIMIIIINKMIKSNGKSYPLVNYFDVGMLIGVLSIIHLPNALLMIALWVSIPILSDVKFRELFLTIISFFFVWLFYGTYLFMKDLSSIILVDLFLARINFLKFDWHYLLPIHYIYIILGLITGLYSISKKRFLSGIQAPVLFSSVIFLFVIFLITGLFLGTQYQIILLGIVPLVILSSYYFFNVEKKLANILFYTLLVATIILQWF